VLFRSRQALLVRRKVLRENHPDIAKSEAQLGDILVRSGNSAAAKIHLQNALASFEAADNPDSTRVVTAKAALADLE